jgi:hypothetical protein
MRPKPGFVLLPALLLAGCGPHPDLTASEAVEAANEKLEKDMPELRGRMDQLEIIVRSEQGKWSLTYGGGTGGIIIEVDKKTGRATTVSVMQ